MRILFICSAKVWGGNEKWVAKTMAGLQKYHDIYFLGKSPELQDRFGKNFPSYWAPFRSVFDWKTKKIIYKVIKDNNIDFVISTKKKEYFLAGLVTMNMGVFHLLRLGIVRKMKVPFWSKLVYGRLNDGIIVNAFKIKEELQKHSWMKGHPVKVIYNGLEQSADGCRQIQNRASQFLIVSTGMLTRRKGYHILIDSIANLSEDYQKRLQVHILGQGREEENLKKQIQKLGLKKVIHLEGFCDPYPWLQRAHLFCLLSRTEGISNALLEAMNCGVPVLTTNAGGTGEFISQAQNGFLVRGEVNEVTEQLKQLIDLPEEQLLNIGQNGKQTVKALFSYTRMINEVETFLHNFA